VRRAVASRRPELSVPRGARRRRWATACVCAAAAAWAVPVRAQTNLALSEAIDLALAGNRALRQLVLSLQAQQLALADAQAQFRFSVQPRGDARVEDDRRTATLGAAVTRRTEFGASAEVGLTAAHDVFDAYPDAYRDVVYVEVRQPLLRNVGALINREPVAQAESAVTAARRQVALNRTDLVLSVIEGQEDLVRLDRELDREQQAGQRLDRFVRLSRARERQGRATRLDVLRAELQRGTAEVRMNAAREQLLSRRAEYAELLGLPPDIELRPEPAPRLVAPLPDLAGAVATALSNRLDFAQLLQDHADAVRGLRIARRNLLPDVSLLSRYQQVGTGADASDAARLDDNSWFVGVALASDLPPRHERNALDAAVLGRQAAELEIERLRAAVARQVRQGLLACANAQAQGPLEERNYEAARARLRLARRLYDMGRGDNFSVSDAEHEFQNAEGRRLSAQATATVAAYRLRRLLGTLIEYPDDLKADAVK